MALNTAQQIKLLVEEKKHILITFRKNGSGDAIASSVALATYLKKLGKQVDVVCDEFALPESLNFLRESKAIKPTMSHLQKFIITVDVAQRGIDELSYDLKDEKLRIFVTPKQGFLTRDSIRTAQSDFKYDLIITLDTQELPSLGSLYDNNTELFFKTPIINIDNKPSNEHFGHVNAIDVTAGATAEVLYDLLSDIGHEHIDPHVATALLTGMLAATRSFKSSNVKPATLQIASKLMKLGADREYIVQRLYQTRSIGTLKLWGQALAHLQSDPAHGLVSTTITRDDFVRASAHERDLYDIVDELILTAPEAKLVLLLHEHAGEQRDEIHGILHATKGYDATALTRDYGGHGDADTASFRVLNRTLPEAQKEVTAAIANQISV